MPMPMAWKLPCQKVDLILPLLELNFVWKSTMHIVNSYEHPTNSVCCTCNCSVLLCLLEKFMPPGVSLLTSLTTRIADRSHCWVVFHHWCHVHTKVVQQGWVLATVAAYWWKTACWTVICSPHWLSTHKTSLSEHVITIWELIATGEDQFLHVQQGVFLQNCNKLDK